MRSNFFLFLVTPSFWHLLPFIVFLPNHAFSAAWLLEAGKLKSFHEVSYYQTSHYVDNSANRQSQPTYRTLEQGNLVEYGLYDNLTLGINLRLAAVNGETNSVINSSAGSIFLNPSNQAQAASARGTNYGISQFKIHARTPIWQDDNTILSTQAALSLPNHFTSDSLPNSGQSTASYELRVLLGKNLKWKETDHFANIELAYEHRDQDLADLIHADLTTGYRLNESLTLMPQLFTSWHTGDNNSLPTNSGDNNYDLIKGQLSVTYPLSAATTLQFGVFQHLYARNTGEGGGAMVSFWVQR